MEWTTSQRMLCIVVIILVGWSRCGWVFIHLPRVASLLALVFTITCWVHAAEPLAQDHLVVRHNADPEYYVEGPGLVRLNDRSYRKRSNRPHPSSPAQHEPHAT